MFCVCWAKAYLNLKATLTDDWVNGEPTLNQHYVSVSCLLVSVHNKGAIPVTNNPDNQIGSLTLEALYFFYENHENQRVFFKFEIIINVFVSFF